MSQPADPEQSPMPAADEHLDREWFLTQLAERTIATPRSCPECTGSREPCNHLDRCPDCAQPRDADAARCPWCWADLTMAGWFPCPECELPMPIDEQSCEVCGATLEWLDTGNDLTGGHGTTFRGARHGHWQIPGYGMYGRVSATWLDGTRHGSTLLTSKPNLVIERHRFGLEHGMSCVLVHPVYQHPAYQPPMGWDERIPFLSFTWFHHGRLVWGIEQEELAATLHRAGG